MESTSIADRRAEFNVIAVHRDALVARRTAESIKAAGYVSTRFYPTFQLAISTASVEPPHVVVLETAEIDEECENFLSRLREISEEILTILIVPATSYLHALQLVNRGLVFESRVSPLASGLELVQAIDRAAGRLYFQFESEQLREYYASKPSSIAHSSPAEIPSRPHDADSGRLAEQVAEHVRKVAGAREPDESLRAFVDGVARLAGDAPTLFLRYLPSHVSLIFSHAALLPEERFRGLGLDLKKRTEISVEGFFQDPANSPLLSDFMREAFQSEQFKAWTVGVGGEYIGLLIVIGPTDDRLKGSLTSLKSVFELGYRHIQVVKEKHSLEMLDPVTGLFNRRQFSLSLEQEITRSRRILMPVSLILISLDRWDEIFAKFGAHQADALLKPIALLMRKTARSNDVLARTGTNEFAMILPHTPQMGAAMKAERFRRMMETMKLPALAHSDFEQLTISCGVSEYPSLASDADGLLKSADDSLDEVRRASGNRVCLAAAAPGFIPDFQPREIPPAAGPSSEERT